MKTADKQTEVCSFFVSWKFLVLTITSSLNPNCPIRPSQIVRSGSPHPNITRRHVPVKPRRARSCIRPRVLVNSCKTRARYTWRPNVPINSCRHRARIILNRSITVSSCKVRVNCTLRQLVLVNCPRIRAKGSMSWLGSRLRYLQAKQRP
jgi:hypothetical protein